MKKFLTTLFITLSCCSTAFSEEDPTCYGTPFNATFNSTGTSATVSSSKDLSHVVLNFCNGTSYKFDNLNQGSSGTFSLNGLTISSVLIKAGCSSETFSRSCVTPTPTPTATKTATSTPTRTATPSPTCTKVPTVTPTKTPTSTSTPTKTPTSTATSTSTPTKTATATATATNTATATSTSTPTSSPTFTPTGTPTPTSTATNTPEPTATPTATPTPVIDCKGEVNGTSYVDQCGICDSNAYNDNATCSDCLGIPNGTDRSCYDCSGVKNGNSTYDPCGVCNGDGSSCKCPYSKVKIDQLDLIKKAKIISNSKSIKYFKKAISCDKNLSKKFKSEISTTSSLLDRYIEVVNSIPKEVELCTGQCVDIAIKSQLVELELITNKLYKQASTAQHGARKACKTKTKPDATTKRITSDLTKKIKDCHSINKVCNN